MVKQPLDRNVQRFRGGLVFKADRLLYHSNLGLRETNKTNSETRQVPALPSPGIDSLFSDGPQRSKPLGTMSYMCHIRSAAAHINLEG